MPYNKDIIKQKSRLKIMIEQKYCEKYGKYWSNY